MPVIIRTSDYEHHDNCERKVYTNWINRNLFNRECLNAYIPLNPDGEDVFDEINDGLIYCETINEIFPNSIDSTVLVIGPNTPKEERVKNLQLAFETARSYGCQIDNLRVYDVFSGVRQSVLELFWQIFYVGLVVPINCENFPEVEILRESNEPKDVVRKMKPEDILIRYINYETHSYDPGCKTIRSFKENFNDGAIYMVLLDSFARQSNVELRYNSSAISKEKNDRLRLEMLFENFDCLKIHGFLIAELMNSQCSESATFKMHLLTMAILFHKFGLECPEIGSIASSQYTTDHEKIHKESNIEKLCRVFLNFITVKPLVTNLCNDCKDSLIFAQVMKLFSPEIFKKEYFIEEFNEEQIESKKIHNAAIIINKFKPFLSIPILDFHAEYIQAGRKKIVCGIVYNLMLFWAININKSNSNNINEFDIEKSRKFNEKELMQWINSLCNDVKIYSFRDSQIQDKFIMAKVIDNTIPNSIDWCYLKELSSRKDRAIYYVNIARREGFPLFIHPDMLASGDYRSTILAFLILKEKIPKNNKNVCPE